MLTIVPFLVSLSIPLFLVMRVLCSKRSVVTVEVLHLFCFIVLKLQSSGKLTSAPCLRIDGQFTGVPACP